MRRFCMSDPLPKPTAILIPDTTRVIGDCDGYFSLNNLHMSALRKNTGSLHHHLHNVALFLEKKCFFV